MTTKYQFQYVKQQERGTVLDIINQHQLHAVLLNLQQMLVVLDLVTQLHVILLHHVVYLLSIANGVRILIA